VGTDSVSFCEMNGLLVATVANPYGPWLEAQRGEIRPASRVRRPSYAVDGTSRKARAELARSRRTRGGAE